MIKILQRIKKAYNLETDAEVADFLGIKPSTLSMQKNRGRLNLQRIIAQCSDLNKNWLLDGIGPIRQATLTHIPIYSSLNMANQKPNFQESSKTGNLATDTIGGSYEFSDSGQVIGYIVSGDSMAPALKKNDIAIINLDGSPSDGAIFLILFDHKIVFRRVKNKEGAYILKSDYNRETFEIQKNKNNHNIIGKLIWTMRPT